jgi:hypothetical protein
MKMTKTKIVMNAAFRALAIIIAITTLSACAGRLSGTYKSSGMFAQTFTFDGDEVTMSAFGINASGTYQISDGKIKIKYSLFGIDSTWEQPFEKKGSSIYIGNDEFKKQ